MRGAAAALLTVGLYGCCCGAPRTEAVLAVPATVAEARALHAPPAVTVTVARETRASGGGSCGHSPVCLVLLPVLVWEVAFPPQVDIIDIVEASGATVHGEWEPDGDLLWAERREAGIARAARLLDLPELGRRLVIEGARAPVGADGAAGAFTPTAVQAQIDLEGAYSAALADRSGGHAELLTEAVGALGAESLPLLTDWLSRPDESESRLEVLTAVCASERAGDALGLRQAVLRIVAPLAEPEMSARGLRCALETPGSAEAPTFAAGLVTPICAEASSSRTWELYDLAQRSEAARPVLQAAAAACASPTRRTLLARAAGAPTDDAAIRTLVDADPDAALTLVPYLNASMAGDRAALFAHLLHADEAGPAVDRLMIADTLVPTASEADILADAYLRYEPSLLGRRDPQGAILTMLARTPASDRAAARARLLTMTETDRRVEAGAARFVLGETQLGGELVAALPPEPCASGPLVGQADLAAHALMLAGCSCEALTALERKSPATSLCYGSP